MPKWQGYEAELGTKHASLRWAKSLLQPARIEALPTIGKMQGNSRCWVVFLRALTLGVKSRVKCFWLWLFQRKTLNSRSHLVDYVFVGTTRKLDQKALLMLTKSTPIGLPMFGSIYIALAQISEIRESIIYSIIQNPQPKRCSSSTH